MKRYRYKYRHTHTQREREREREEKGFSFDSMDPKKIRARGQEGGKKGARREQEGDSERCWYDGSGWKEGREKETLQNYTRK